MNEEVILFKSADEFRSRNGYVEALIVAKGELERIVGKYTFSEKEALRCGLNGCGTPHWNGYVIRTKSGQETHCGKDCGKREFDVEFAAVEATFRRSLDTQQRRTWLEGMLERRDSMLAEAASCVAQLQPVCTQLQDVVQRINRERDLAVAFRSALRAGGAIRVEHRVDSKAADALGLSQAQRRQLETVATLDGIGAIHDGGASDRMHVESCLSSLRSNVIPSLRQFSRESLTVLSYAKLKAKTREMDNCLDLLKRATSALEEARRFLLPANLRKLAHLPGSSQRAERVRRHFSQI